MCKRSPRRQASPCLPSAAKAAGAPLKNRLLNIPVNKTALIQFIDAS
jgi:hypothetical protein